MIYEKIRLFVVPASTTQRQKSFLLSRTELPYGHDKVEFLFFTSICLNMMCWLYNCSLKITLIFSPPYLVCCQICLASNNDIAFLILSSELRWKLRNESKSFLKGLSPKSRRCRKLLEFLLIFMQLGGFILIYWLIKVFFLGNFNFFQAPITDIWDFPCMVPLLQLGQRRGEGLQKLRKGVGDQ